MGLGAPRQFPRFLELDRDIRRIIWDMVDEDLNKDNDIIEIAFTRAPSYQKPEYLGRRRARVLWRYRMYQRNPSPLLSLNPESRASYIRSHPNILRLNKQVPIRFHRRRDTVYLDASSFAALWFYAQHHRMEFFGEKDYLLRGMDQIQRLGSYHPSGSTAPAGSTANRMGLRNLRVQYEVFGDLRRIRLLGTRNILPQVFPDVRAGGSVLDLIKDEPEGQLIILRDWINRNGRPRFTAAQRAVIQNHLDSIDGSLDIFDQLLLAAVDELDIPEGP
jgi:hypothetical protein